MNWEIAANVATVIAAGAVSVTLVYVASQAKSLSNQVTVSVGLLENQTSQVRVSL